MRKWMSTLDDKAKNMEGQEADCKCNCSNTIMASFVIGLAASLIFGWVIFPKLLYSQKRQPVDYNHAIHLGLVDNGCQSCHFYREDGSFSGIPKLENCAQCHESMQGETEAEKILVEKYVQQGREVPWLVYARQPDCVFFSHATHTERSRLDCVVCHGHIGTSTSTPIYEENRITGVSRDIWGRNIAGIKMNSWDRMKMDDCAECHMEMAGKKDACFVCHK